MVRGREKICAFIVNGLQVPGTCFSLAEIPEELRNTGMRESSNVICFGSRIHRNGILHIKLDRLTYK